MTNIFREAKQLLDKKDAGGELTDDELRLINTAIIPLMVETDGIFPNDITIGEGLDELANMVDEEPEILRDPSTRSEPCKKRNPRFMSEPSCVRNPQRLSEPEVKRNPVPPSEP